MSVGRKLGTQSKTAANGHIGKNKTPSPGAFILTHLIYPLLHGDTWRPEPQAVVLRTPPTGA